MSFDLTAHRLRFETTALDPILLNEHKGSSIRGALFHALRGGAGPSGWAGFCYNKAVIACTHCHLAAGCPVCTLVSTLNPSSDRGYTVPRPYTIEPPLTQGIAFPPGSRLDFGLTLFANALPLFPYVIQAVERGMGPAGIGRRDQANRFRRGRFRLDAVWAENPLSGVAHPVLGHAGNQVAFPDLPVTHDQVQQQAAKIAAAGAGSAITLRFLTPTRLTERGQPLRRPAFRPLFHRLLERLTSLARDFTDTPVDEALRYRLVGLADAVETLRDDTAWVELRSYSTRRGAESPISGFAGEATFAGQLEPFLPWLIWGQLAHVGKDAVKGNGWYTIRPAGRGGPP